MVAMEATGGIRESSRQGAMVWAEPDPRATLANRDVAGGFDFAVAGDEVPGGGAFRVRSGVGCGSGAAGGHSSTAHDVFCLRVHGRAYGIGVGNEHGAIPTGGSEVRFRD